MTVPMVKWATVWNAIAADATVQLGETQLNSPGFARSIYLEINGGDTPSWTLDIQGKVSPDATWHNISYFVTDTTVAAPTQAQLTVNWTTAKHYVIPQPPPFVRLVGVRTTGTITAYASFSSEGYSAGGLSLTPASGTVTLGAGTALAGSIAAVPSTSSVMNGVTPLSPAFAAISGATSGDNTLVAADATKKIRVLSLYLVAVTAVTVRFEGGAGGTALSGVMSIGANGGIVLPFNPNGWFETAANTLLNMELGGAVQTSGGLSYVLV